MARRPNWGPTANMRIECTITYGCNAVCWGCNKAVGLAKFPNTNMTVDQMKRAVDQLIEQKIWIKRFTVTGGEPIVHKGLQQLINEVARIPDLAWLRVLSNGVASTEEARNNIKLPEGSKWRVEPIDDIYDPMSGKNEKGVRMRDRVHKPFWISPADMGVESTFENCSVKNYCGAGLDANGWMACGKAGMFGRLLGIDPYLREGDITKHIKTPINDICKHCQYGAGRKFQSDLAKDVDSGKVLHDISPTFEKAFKDYKQTKTQFERF